MHELVSMASLLEGFCGLNLILIRNSMYFEFIDGTCDCGVVKCFLYRIRNIIHNKYRSHIISAVGRIVYLILAD